MYDTPHDFVLIHILIHDSVSSMLYSVQYLSYLRFLISVASREAQFGFSERVWDNWHPNLPVGAIQLAGAGLHTATNNQQITGPFLGRVSEIDRLKLL